MIRLIIFLLISPNFLIVVLCGSSVLGAIIGFIPTAIAEIVFTKEQKKAEKIAAMLSIKDLQDYRKFADKNKKEINYIEQDETSTIFNEIKKAQLLKKK